ncbi:chromodomain-helicase-DNA-binding protein 2-like [Hetaerina americana]|uniref:chromodomain-helicase-DNA-binding protein 2-like n=1 Tax=Hetaerina americana TaxID=62018 RepID=UPI003A7F5157
MRRLTKNKRKNSETNSEVKQENGDTTDTNAIAAESTPRGSKTRKSRINSEAESSHTSSKRTKQEDKDDDQMCREAEMVVDSRIQRKKVQYKVRWRNFSASEDTWESPDDLDPDLIEAFKSSLNETNTEINESDEEEVVPKVRNPVVESARKPRAKSGREYEVESILAVRTMKNRRRYKVHWKGFSSDEDCWISENKLSCPEILQDFLRREKERRNLPKPIKVEGDTEEYEVEKVIEVRFKKGGAREFLIRWKGFTAKDDTWEPEENLNCPDLISKFMAKVEKAKTTTSRELRANPVMTERLTLNMKSASLRYSRRPQTQNRPTYHNFLE